MVARIEQTPKIRAALSLRALKKTARSQAQSDLISRGTTRNVSAWLSRATCRHYETLLVSHFDELEKERNKVLALRDAMRIEVQELKSKISDLDLSLRSVNSRSLDLNFPETPESTGNSSVDWDSLPETPSVGWESLPHTPSVDVESLPETRSVDWESLPGTAELDTNSLENWAGDFLDLAIMPDAEHIL